MHRRSTLSFRALTRVPIFGGIAILLSALLVLTIGVPESAGARGLSNPGRDSIPALTSAPLGERSTLRPDGDFGQLAEEAENGFVNPGPAEKVAEPKAPAGFDLATSHVVSRDEYSNTFKNTDGTNTLQVERGPINVKVGSSWTPAQTALTANDKRGWVVDQNPLSPSFGAYADDPSVFSAVSGGQAIVGPTLRGWVAPLLGPEEMVASWREYRDNVEPQFATRSAMAQLACHQVGFPVINARNGYYWLSGDDLKFAIDIEFGRPEVSEIEMLGTMCNPAM